MSYEKLKTSYVIIICTYDAFGMDEPVYSFQTYDKNLQLPLDDESFTIILNTSCSPEKVPERLQAFYAYINDPARKESELVKKIDDRVKKFNSAEWRHRRMTFEYYLDRKFEEGVEQGQEAVNALNRLLLAENRLEDLQKSLEDKEYQQKLMEEYKLKDLV